MTVLCLTVLNDSSTLDNKSIEILNSSQSVHDCTVLTSEEGNRKERQQSVDAAIYVIVVLAVYTLAIVVLFLKYMNRGRNTDAETNSFFLYNNYYDFRDSYSNIKQDYDYYSYLNKKERFGNGCNLLYVDNPQIENKQRLKATEIALHKLFEDNYFMKQSSHDNSSITRKAALSLQVKSVKDMKRSEREKYLSNYYHKNRYLPIKLQSTVNYKSENNGESDSSDASDKNSSRHHRKVKSPSVDSTREDDVIIDSAFSSTSDASLAEENSSHPPLKTVLAEADTCYSDDDFSAGNLMNIRDYKGASSVMKCNSKMFKNSHSSIDSAVIV